jgi:hypothetical protein
MVDSSAGIGTLGERSLHAALKEWYAEQGDRFECEVDGYVIDIVRGDLLVEIQTANFAAMKRKLAALTGRHAVHVVHPIAAEKFIVKYGPDGVTQVSRRRSPKRGSVLDLFRELVSFPHLVALDTFSVEVLLTREEEIRVNDGAGSWRRGGWSIVDQRLVEVVDRVRLASPADFRALLPPGLPDPFTTRDMADALGERVNLMGKMAYCLRKMAAVEMVGRRGRAYLYSLPS